MWVREGHQPDRPTPPQEQGERLACFDRAKGEQLRVTLETFNGYPFVRLAVWAAGNDGQVWPVKGRAVTLKMRELGPLAEALAAAAGQGQGTPQSGTAAPSDEPTRYVDKGRVQRPDWREQQLPRAEGGGGTFDECS